MNKIQVLVVEDDAPTARLILDVLREGGYDALAVDTLAKARASLKTAPPDLMVLDRMMPDGDGVDILIEVRRSEKLKSTPIIFLTGQKTVAERVKGLRTGADDYMPKPFDNAELAARVDALLRRYGKGPEPETLEAVRIKLDRVSYKVWVGGKEISLTPKEFDLLWFLIRRKNQVLTREFLLQRVWGRDSGLTANTVDAVVSNLREKIGNPADKIAAVRGFGYRFDA
jgi:two-component system alkaline phosphatase synthesis response regulator PhoP